MRYTILPILFFMLSACGATEEKDSIEADSDYNDEGPFLDGVGEDVEGHVPIGYQFDYTVNCDTLDKETLEEMVMNNAYFDMSITVTDSIVVSYGDPSDAYNFYDGYYAFENDTIKLWYTTGSWEDLDSYCVYRHKFTVPKPDLEEVVIEVNGECQLVNLK